MTSFSAKSPFACGAAAALALLAIFLQPTSARAEGEPPKASPAANPADPPPLAANPTDPPPLAANPAFAPASTPPPTPELAPAATPTPPEPPTARLEIDGSFAGSGYAVTREGANKADATGTTYLGTLGARLFLSPVKDDDAPRTQLPYLQRTSSIGAYVSVGSGQARVRDDSSSVYVGADAEVYALPALVLTGRVSYSQTTLSELVVPRRFGSLGVGVGYRAGENLLSVSYDQELQVLGGNAQTLRLGTLTLSDFVVIDRAVALRVYGSVVDGGAVGGASITYYPTNELGISIRGYGGSIGAGVGTIKNTFTVAGAGGGLSYWVARVLQVGAWYRLSASVGPNGPGLVASTGTEHGVEFGVTVRIP